MKIKCSENEAVFFKAEIDGILVCKNVFFDCYILHRI
jgi:hypothetical protein